MQAGAYPTGLCVETGDCIAVFVVLWAVCFVVVVLFGLSVSTHKSIRGKMGPQLTEGCLTVLCCGLGNQPIDASSPRQLVVLVFVQSAGFLVCRVLLVTVQ